VFGSQTDPADLPGLETITEADALLVSVRRRPLKPAQMKLLRDYVAAGKPVLGIRTASHAFSLRGAKPPAGLETWESWDADVFGGHYTGHHTNGVNYTVTAAGEAEVNPIFKSLQTTATSTAVTPLVGHGSLYKTRPLAGTTWWLLMGHIPGQAEEPVAWMNHRVDNGLSFYTSFGHPDDFAEPAFRKLLVAALRVLTRPRS
jgi:Trehalose utilisation